MLRNRAALVRRAIESRSSFLSDVNADPDLPEPMASIETPVFLDGKPVYEIGMFLSLKKFHDLMQRQNFPPNWLSGIVDRKGRLCREDSRAIMGVRGRWRAPNFAMLREVCLHRP